MAEIGGGEEPHEALAGCEHEAVVEMGQKGVILVVWKGCWPWRERSPSREECCT